MENNNELYETPTADVVWVKTESVILTGSPAGGENFNPWETE